MEKTVHFNITGEGLTRIARDMFLSERPDKAYRLITEGLHGDRGTLAVVAQDLLDGKVKLTGDAVEGIDVEEETPADVAGYLQNMGYIYAGRFFDKNGWYRPYARVTNFGLEDFEATQKRVNGDHQRPLSLKERAYYYMDDHRQDKALSANGEKDVFLCEPCEAPPQWWKGNADLADALKDCKTHDRGLKVKGYEQDVVPYLQEVKKEWGTLQRREWTDKEAQAVLDKQREEMAVRLRAMELKGYRDLIVAQAGDAWYDLTNEAGSVLLRVPYAPFVRWALSRTNLDRLAPAWTNICPQGLKMGSDDQDHSDWYVGAGGDLEDGYPYDEELHHVAIDHMGQLQAQFGQHKVTVIVKGSKSLVHGTVGKEILVVKSLHPDYLSQALKSELVITEAGGAMAHLAQEATANGLPIVLVRDAVDKFPKGTMMTVDLDTGDMRIHDLKG